MSFSISKDVNATTITTGSLSIAGQTQKTGFGKCVTLNNEQLIALAPSFIPSPNTSYLVTPSAPVTLSFLLADVSAQSNLAVGECIQFTMTNSGNNPVTMGTGGPGLVSTGIMYGNIYSYWSVGYVLCRTDAETYVLNTTSYANLD